MIRNYSFTPELDIKISKSFEFEMLAMSDSDGHFDSTTCLKKGTGYRKRTT